MNDLCNKRSGIEVRYGTELIGTLACLERMIICGCLQGALPRGSARGGIGTPGSGLF